MAALLSTTLSVVPLRTPEDALGRIKEKLAVLFVIVSDGQENASREWTRAKIFERISAKQKDDGWDFLYIGANQDSYAEGAAVGIASGAVADFAATSRGAGAMWKSFNGASYDSYRTVRSSMPVEASLLRAGYDYFGASRSAFEPGHVTDNSAVVTPAQPKWKARSPRLRGPVVR